MLFEVFDRDIAGDTNGYQNPAFFLGFEIPGFYQDGELGWATPVELFPGPQDEGHLVVAPSNETFNDGIRATLPGEFFDAAAITAVFAGYIGSSRYLFVDLLAMVTGGAVGLWIQLLQLSNSACI